MGGGASKSTEGAGTSGDITLYRRNQDARFQPYASYSEGGSPADYD